jgi:hypothetical protein
MASRVSKPLLAIASGLLLVGLTNSAKAVLITLEDQTGPTTYAAACAAITCPQTVVENTSAGQATFTGGVILTNPTSLPADETSVYGSTSFVSGLVNPITITFQNAVSNFLVDVINGLTTTTSYTVADNVGNSSTFSLPPNSSSGATTIGFPASGNVVTITSEATPFDIFIDNVQFNVPISCSDNSCQVTGVPEPGSLGLLALATTCAFGFWRVRRS